MIISKLEKRVCIEKRACIISIDIEVTDLDLAEFDYQGFDMLPDDSIPDILLAISRMYKIKKGRLIKAKLLPIISK